MVLSGDSMQLPACNDEIVKVTVNHAECKYITDIMKPYCAAAKLMIEARLFMLETTPRFEGDKEHKNLMLKMHSGKQIRNDDLWRFKVLTNEDF